MTWSLALLTLMPCLLCTVSAGFSCPNGLVYMANGPGKNCIKSCDYPNPNPLYCIGSQPGCYCPDSKPYETCTLDGIPTCVASLDECICPPGQSYQACPHTRTCDDLISKVKKCKPGCGCSKNTVWHQGQCVKPRVCTCPNKCVKQGCKECNKCTCKNGKVKSCTKKGCPDLTTKPGFNSLYSSGCWRLCPSRKICIFYSPCPDEFKPSCKTFPGGFCKECNKCQCNKDGTAICSVNVQPCKDALEQSVSSGCYRLVKGRCTYVNPCPEHPSEENCCQCSKAGQMSCKECNECECVNGLKVCRKGLCPDPTDSNQQGCYVVRSYPGYPKRCFFVSPCPTGQPVGSEICTGGYPNQEYCNNCLLCKCGQLCPASRCPDPKLDSCYIYNEKEGHCEFVSPCPQCCCEGEMTCRDCNECVCKDGKTSCSNKKCGNPIDKGCYIYNGRRCEFVIPCPPNAVTDPQAFCDSNPGASFCRANDCNVCGCSNTVPGPIACTRIGCILPVGCWRPQDGYCKFFYPCPN